MTDEQAQVVICGAGIAGVSAAYALTVEHGLRKVVLVDELPPLSLTSDHSTECYRNWWPGPDDAMVALMNRSIDRLEELARRYGNFFHLNRRGYLYCTADPQRAQQMEQEAAQVAALGAGPLRVHHRGETSTYRPPAAQGFEDAPEGADLLLNSSLIKSISLTYPPASVRCFMCGVPVGSAPSNWACSCCRKAVLTERALCRRGWWGSSAVPVG